MKKITKLSFLFLLLGIVTGCVKDVSDNENSLLEYTDNQKITFAQDEYAIYSGESVVIEENYKGVTYQAMGINKDAVQLDTKTGTFTFDDSIMNKTQVLYAAAYNGYITTPVVVTLLHDYEVADIFFRNKSQYIMDGEFITAYASLPYAVTYELKEPVSGISINNTSGKVTFTNNVKNETSFDVVAKSHNGAQTTKTFKTMTEDFITVKESRQIIEKNNQYDAKFVLDFSLQTAAKKDGIIALSDEHNREIDGSYYHYDESTSTLSIHADYLNSVYDGENIIKIITSRNTVTIEVVVATKFIYTASDLASINDTTASLEGYYVLMDDIDLSTYLAKGSEGYNDGKGWNPIGQYTDIADPNIAEAKSFKGTFDGNGHVITNLYINRKDVASFNAGLFGYVTSSSIIKNVGVTGTMDVSSYSGGLVGSNSGMISNCWADVDVVADSGSEGVYRYLGGFVGNNFGTIEGCYSLGSVKCDSYFGAFVGSNQGEISNCYALKGQYSEQFVGFGQIQDNCQLFTSLQEIKNASYNAFSSDYWSLKEGELPVLKVLFVEKNVRKIVIKDDIAEQIYYPGDEITLEALIYPKELQEQYDSMITFSVVKNGGVTISNGNILKVFNPLNSVITINAELIIDENIVFHDTLSINVGKRIEKLEVLTGVDIMKAGSRYQIGASYMPEDATEEVEYRLSGKNLVGINLNENIITISEDTTCDEFEVYAISKQGKVKSEAKKITINPLHVLETKYVYPEEVEQYLSFSFTNSIDLNNVHVTLFGKQISYSINGQEILIANDVFDDLMGVELVFQFVFENGERYQQKVYLFNHQKYEETTIKEMYEDVIEISSKDDFYRYFNISLTSTFDENKIENYQKVYILTSDIDFENEEIQGIGSSSDGDYSRTFAGQFYGLGHTISNVKVIQNDKVLTDSSSTSNLYGVGFFSALTGSVYDLNFQEIEVSGKNFVGGVVGMMLSGIVENCHVYNTKASIKASGQSYSSGDIHVGIIIGRLFGGQCIASSGYKSQIIG